MIRSALMALGLSASGLGAGATFAQGLVPTAPIVDSCGGTRLVLEAAVETSDLTRASDVMAARLGGVFSSVFQYTEVFDSQIILSLPEGVSADVSLLEPLLQRVEFGFHTVTNHVAPGSVVELEAGQLLLPHAEYADQSYVIEAKPVLDGSSIADARQIFDQNNRPAVNFRFDAVGAKIFADYTSANIGEPFAIVLDGQVMSAPLIMSAIFGGGGIITGDFTVEEAAELGAILRGGVLPFDLVIVDAIPVDGSDPSADFCP